ncbi:MAG: hypothetical protein WC770_00980 [Phycisphaerae bacterium]
MAWADKDEIDASALGECVFDGTAEASMPPYDWALLADLDNNGAVGFSEAGFFVALRSIMAMADAGGNKKSEPKRQRRVFRRGRPMCLPTVIPRRPLWGSAVEPRRESIVFSPLACQGVHHSNRIRTQGVS